MRRLGVVLAALFLLVSFCPTASADQLILNGGFEAGRYPECYIPEWTTWNPTGNVTCGVRTPTAGFPFEVHSGSYAAFFGPIDGFTHLAQTITTVPGGAYDLSFWLKQYEDPGTAIEDRESEFHLFWNTTQLASFTNPAPYGYTLLQFSGLVATGASTVVEFEFWNPPGQWWIDDVSVTTVPEPTSLVLLGTGLVGLARWRKRHG